MLLISTALVFDPAARDSFRLPKLLLAEILGLASLLPLLLDALLRVEERLRWRATALLATAPMVIAAAVSAAGSRHPEAAFDGLWHVGVGAVCLVGWSTGLGRPRLRRLLNLMLLPAALLALIGISQVAGVFQPVQPLQQLGRRFEMVSLAGNVGDLAMYLALPTLVAFSGCLERRGRKRIAYGMLLGLLAGTLLLTRTFTVLVAVTLGCLVAGALRLDRRRFLRMSALLFLVVILGLLLVPGLGDRLRESGEAMADGQVDIVLSGRLDAWRAGAWMFRQHPFAGVGVGAFATEFSPARLALMAEDAVRERNFHESFDTAHNDYLQLAAEQGALGILALLTAVTVAVSALRRRRGAFASDSDRALGGGVVVTLAIVALADFPFQLALTVYPALLFLAWLLADEDEGPARR